MKAIKNYFTLFKNNGKIDWVLVTLAIFMNMIVAINVFIHHPKIGYDVTEHITYAQVLLDGLPGPEKTGEFFSPPLPYVLPAIYDAVCEKFYPTNALLDQSGSLVTFECRWPLAKFAQVINLILSFGITLIVLAICEQLKPGNRFYKIATLLFLSMLTVYYKTFSQFRGETYLLFFVLLSIFLLMRFVSRGTTTWKEMIGLGGVLGALVLSRQWGFFVFPAIILFTGWLYIQNKNLGVIVAKWLVLGLIVSVLVGGWFYISLYVRFGTFTAFNRPTEGFSLSNLKYLRNTGLKDWVIFTKPVRENFQQGILPIYYSEIWGDYWGFLTFIPETSYFGELGKVNTDEIAPYLGRVNLMSIPPSIIFLCGLLHSTLQLIPRKVAPLTPERIGFALMMFICICSVLGYAWFILSYFNVTQTTLKATYHIQFLALLPFLGADFLDWVRGKKNWLWSLIIFLNVLVLIHNIPALISREHY